MTGMMIAARRVVLGLILGAAGVSAQAERVEMTGQFPAEFKEPGLLSSLHVERFSGDGGPALSLAVERALSDGAPFKLVAGEAGKNSAEGTMAGAVTTRVSEAGEIQIRENCQAFDERRNCIQVVKVPVQCWRRSIDVDADIRIVRNKEGEIIYSKTHPFREQAVWCQNTSAPATAGERITSAMAAIAQNVRREISPYQETYKVKLREKDKGLPKDLAKQLKASIKLSDSNFPAACEQWNSLEKMAPGHATLIYNLAVCAERRAEYPTAADLYRQAAAGGADKGDEGLERVLRLIAALRDEQERVRRRNGL